MKRDCRLSLHACVRNHEIPILRLNAHLFATAAAVLITGLGANAAAADRPPNLVFIMADDLGYNELASYGQRVYPTPHTDRLAREGMRFTVCSPTRYAVVTGTDPYRHSHSTQPRQLPSTFIKALEIMLHPFQDREIQITECEYQESRRLLIKSQ